MHTWMEWLTWGLMIFSILMFHYSSRKSIASAKALSRDLHEAHSLIFDAMKVLRDHDDFDSRFTWNKLHDYMELKLTQYGLQQVPPLPRRTKQ